MRQAVVWELSKLRQTAWTEDLKVSVDHATTC